MHLNFIHEFYIMLLQFKHLDILIALKIHLTNHFCWKNALNSVVRERRMVVFLEEGQYRIVLEKLLEEQAQP
jgi:hypothetical protein